MSDSTHEALRAHIKKWRKGNRKRGIEVNPLGELDEMVRFLCSIFDQLAKREAMAAKEFERNERAKVEMEFGGRR
jgi:hypothetical protein